MSDTTGNVLLRGGLQAVPVASFPADSVDFVDEKKVIIHQTEDTTTHDDRTEQIATHLGLKFVHGGQVKWRSDAKAHPRNWSWKRKAFDTTLVLVLDLFTTAVSTAGPSVAEDAKAEYGLSRVKALIIFASMYQFGQAIGGVFFPPYSEAFGRKRVYVFSTILYCISCIIIGIPKSSISAAIGRFVSGIMSAVPSVIVSGSLDDMYNMKQRVWMMYAWSCATTAGLLLGPIYGSYVASSLGWRGVFNTAAITTAALAILLLFTKESRPSRIISQHLQQLKSQTGLETLETLDVDYVPDFQTFIKTTVLRPSHMFFTEPIVLVVSIMSSVGWALIYLLTEAIPVIYINFSFTRQQSSLMFLALLIGIFLGIFIRMHDYKKLFAHEELSIPLHPEDKLTGFSIAAPSLAVGFWWLALTLPPASTLPWYASIPGLIAIGFATNEFACTLSGYLADSYTVYASSAFAALSFLRAILGAIFPLVGNPMFAKLGLNWASVVLAAAATVFCVTPFWFGRFGKGIRQRSQFAKYSLEVNRVVMIGDEVIE